MKKLNLSQRARQDLAEIIDFISVDNPDAANDLNKRIEQTCALLASQPEMGRLRLEFQYSELRSFPVGKYIVFYQPTKTELLVVRIVHSARDIRVL